MERLKSYVYNKSTKGVNERINELLKILIDLSDEYGTFTSEKLTEAYPLWGALYTGGSIEKDKIKLILDFKKLKKEGILSKSFPNSREFNLHEPPSKKSSTSIVHKEQVNKENITEKKLKELEIYYDELSSALDYFYPNADHSKFIEWRNLINQINRAIENPEKWKELRTLKFS